MYHYDYFSLEIKDTKKILYGTIIKGEKVLLVVATEPLSEGEMGESGKEWGKENLGRGLSPSSNETDILTKSRISTKSYEQNPHYYQQDVENYI